MSFGFATGTPLSTTTTLGSATGAASTASAGDTHYDALRKANETLRHALENGVISPSVANQVKSTLSNLFPAETAVSATAFAESAASHNANGNTEMTPEVHRQYYSANVLLNLLLASSADVTGLEDLLAAVASSASSSIIAFIGRELAKQSVKQATNSVVGLSSGGAPFATHSDANPVLLASQALFLLTQRFQLTDVTIKELLSVTELLLGEISALFSHGLHASTSFVEFRSSNATSNLNTVTYLCTWSLGNILSAWSLLTPSAGGTAIPNQLLRSPTVGLMVEEWLSKMLKLPFASNGQGMGMTLGGGSATASYESSSLLNASPRNSAISLSRAGSMQFPSSKPSPSPAAPAHPAHWASTHMSVKLPCAFLSMVELMLGAFLVGRKDERGLDLVVESFYGDRSDVSGLHQYHATSNNSNTNGGGSRGGPSSSNPGAPSSAFLTGKVTKRIMQLAPVVTGQLSIPLAAIAATPFKLLSLIVDDLLAAVHHVADLDMKTYHVYLQQHREDELHALQRGGAGGGAPILSQGGALDTSSMGGYLNQHHPIGSHHHHHHHSHHGGSLLFTSELAHLFSCFSWCLSVMPVAPTLTPLPEDNGETAISFFTLKNALEHVKAVFGIQRQSSNLWEPFCHKIVGSFLDLLCQLCRDTVLAERVHRLLFQETAVGECVELQWPSLLSQAKECIQQLQVVEAGGRSDGASAVIRSRLTSGASSNSSGMWAHNNRQHSRAFAALHQERYIERFFTLLRQLMHASHLSQTKAENVFQLGDTVSIEVILGLLLQGSALSPKVLGLCLSLLASAVTNAADAERVWQVLDESGLFQIPSAKFQQLNSDEGAINVFGAPSQSFTLLRPQASDPELTVTSLPGHVLCESKRATYPITVGFLRLLHALFTCNANMLSHRSAVCQQLVKFVASDVLCGVRKRSFDVEEERSLVLSLAAAVCTAAFSIRFYGNSTASHQNANRSTTTTAAYSSYISTNPTSSTATTTATFAAAPTSISYATIMSSARAPADALADLLDVLHRCATELLDRPLTTTLLTSLRHALALLNASFDAQVEQQVPTAFPVEARTTGNSDYVASLLKICSLSSDSIVHYFSLKLLMNISPHMASSTARSLLMKPEVALRLTQSLAELAQPDTAFPDVFDTTCPEVDDHFKQLRAQPAFHMQEKSLLLDLFVKHSGQSVPSLVSLFMGLSFTPRVATSSASSSSASSTSFLEPSSSGLLDAIISGANSPTLLAQYPFLSAKYVRLIYAMKLNTQISSTEVFRRSLQERGASDYLDGVLALNLQALSSDELTRCGYILKTIALDVFQNRSAGSATAKLVARFLNAGNNAAAGANNNHSSINTSLSLVVAQQTTHNNTHSPAVIEAYRFGTWASLVLSALPAFPSLPTPPGGLEAYVFRTANNVPQYSIHRLYEAFHQSALKKGGLDTTFGGAGAAAGNPSSSVVAQQGLRAQLNMFLEANECLAAYAATLQFLEGWTTLLEVAVSGLSPLTTFTESDLLFLLHSALQALSATAFFTVAAQEQMLKSLIRAVSTILTTLHAKTHQIVKQATAALVASEGNKITSEAVEKHMATLFSTIWNKSDVNAVLSALLNAVGQIASRVVGLRADFYNALLVFLSLPQLPIDELQLYKHHNALFAVLVQDMAYVESPVTHFAALNVLRKVLFLSPPMREVFCLSQKGTGGCCATTLVQFTASAFVTLDELVCSRLASTVPDVSAPSPSANMPQDVRFLSYVSQALFDIFAILSVDFAEMIFRANAITLCNNMRCWASGSRATLHMLASSSELHGSVAGATVGGNVHRSSNSGGLLDAQRLGNDVIRQVLHGCLRWYNILLKALPMYEDAVVSVAHFVREQKLLIQIAFAAVGGGVTAIAHLPTSGGEPLSLSLLAEATEILFNLSSTMLAPHCQALVNTFGIPQLLSHITRPEVRKSLTLDGVPGGANGSAASAAAAASVVVGSSAALNPPLYRLLVLSRAVRNLSLFLVNVEAPTSPSAVVSSSTPVVHSQSGNTASSFSISSGSSSSSSAYQPVSVAVLLGWLQQLSIAVEDVSKPLPTSLLHGNNLLEQRQLCVAIQAALIASLTGVTHLLEANVLRSSSPTPQHLARTVSDTCREALTIFTQLRQKGTVPISVSLAPFSLHGRSAAAGASGGIGFASSSAGSHSQHNVTIGEMASSVFRTASSATGTASQSSPQDTLESMVHRAEVALATLRGCVAA